MIKKTPEHAADRDTTRTTRDPRLERVCSVRFNSSAFFSSQVDLMPTFAELAGVDVPHEKVDASCRRVGA